MNSKGKTVPRFLRRAAESRSVQGQELWLPPPSYGGVVVTPKVAMSVAAFFAAVNCIATDLACLSRDVFRRLPGGGKVEDPEHPVHDLVSLQPNDETTAFLFFQTIFAHCLVFGNGYAEIQVRGDGRPYALYLLDPNLTKAKRRDDGTLYYSLGDGRALPKERVLHFAGLGFDAISGFELYDLCRDIIALGKAAELFGLTFFGNGAYAGGFLETPHVLKPEARKNLRESWESLHRGPDKAHRTAVLEGGVKYSKATVDNEAAQFLETRKFQILEVARIFRCPPNKIGDYSESHLANLEESNTDYLTTTLMPWLVMSEQSMNVKLLRRDERRTWLIKTNMETFLRGNSAARSAYYQQMNAIGVYSRNDIAAKEGVNPIEGGDLHFYPLNMGVLEEKSAQTKATTESKPDASTNPDEGASDASQAD